MLFLSLDVYAWSLMYGFIFREYAKNAHIISLQHGDAKTIFITLLDNYHVLEKNL
jgi:hypothetical protein